jgi:hypothetical protein
MIVLAENGDAAFVVPNLIQPRAGMVDVVIHGVPGRFGTTEECDTEIPAAVVAQLLINEGIPLGTPLRCITCHGGENPDPAVGPAAAQLLATVWNGPVEAPNGFCIVTRNSIRIDLGDWIPAVSGGQQFDVFHDSQGQPIGQGQGTFVPFRP